MAGSTENPTMAELGSESPTMAEPGREATEFIALGAVDEERRRREAADLARQQVVGRRLQRILFLFRTGRSLEHTWRNIVELAQDMVEEEGSGRRRRNRSARRD